MTALNRTMRDLRRSRKAQMPFSIIAVLILVLSSTSIVLVYGVDVGDKEIPRKALEELKGALRDGHDDVEGLAYAAAVRTISAVEDLNEAELGSRFHANLAGEISKAYPCCDGDVQSQVEAANISLVFLRASLMESYSHNGADGEQWEGASIPSYFSLLGNYTIEVSNPKGKLCRTYELDRDLYVPVPLLLDRLQRLTSSAEPRGELESIVRSELSALAQDRILRGYGMSSKTGLESTETILTQDDVRRAVNLALVLIELRYAGNADRSAIDPISGLEYFAEMGTDGVDPAELFLMSYGEGAIDLAPLAAQAIYSMADALVLRWLDYLNIIDLVNLGEDVQDFVSWSVSDILDCLTEGDRAQEEIIGYLTRTMSEAGVPDYDYRWFDYGWPDITIDVPALEFIFVDDSGQEIPRTIQGSYALDLPAVDLMTSPAWGEFYRDYTTAAHELAVQLQLFVEGIAEGIASTCTLPMASVDLDPTDGRSYLELLDDQIQAAFLENPSWLKPSLEHAREAMGIRDGLAQATTEFIDQHWKDLFEMDDAVRKAMADLSWNLAGEINGTPGFSASSAENARMRIENLMTTEEWGVKAAIEEAFAERAAPVLQRFDSVLSQRMSTISPLVYPIAMGFTSLPGVEMLVTSLMVDMVGDIEKSRSALGGPVSLALRDGIELTLSEGQVRNEELTVEGLLSGFEVSIILPWQYDRASSAYPNRHITDIMDLSLTPYLTQWGVSCHASVELSLGAVGNGTVASERSATIPIDLDLVIVAESAWSLQGVEYTPTTTLLKDIQKFLEKIWDFLVSGAQALGGLAYKLFGLFTQFMTTIASMATEPLRLIGEAVSYAVELLERVITDLMSMVLEAVAEALASALSGTVIKLSLLGMALDVYISPMDSKLPGADDLVRMDLTMSCLGATMRTSMRVLRLADDVHTILGDLELGGDEWKVSIVLDPLQSVYDHQVEINGFLGGTTFELVMPDVELNQKEAVALHDVPGLGAVLDSIPSPIPGTKISVDGGLEMVANMAGSDHVVINEVELNPQGKDASREWVELYNPLSVPVDVTGWKLVSSRGTTCEEMLDGTIPGYGHMVHTFSGQALDNGADKGFPVQDSVVLLDGEGHRIDAAPWLKDLADDGRTWQRGYDSSSSWEFRDGTRGASNGFVLLGSASLDDIVPLIQTSFQHALAKQQLAMPDLSVLEQVLQDALGEISDRFVDSVGQRLSSVRLYVQFSLVDATGMAGAGFSIALCFDGEAAEECFRWMMGSIGAALQDPLNPLSAMSKVEPPVKTMLEHTFVQFSAFVKVGVPPSLLTGTVSPSVTGSATVKVNLALLGMLNDFGGEGELDFGIVVTGLPLGKVKGTAGLATTANVDVWVLRGVVRPA